MINILCKLIAKIVFTGINGTILIIPLVILIRVMVVQAKELIEMLREV